MWRVEYNNDVSGDDEGFWEWWEVTDGKRTFKTSDQDDAEWLFELLSKYSEKVPN